LVGSFDAPITATASGARNDETRSPKLFAAERGLALRGEGIDAFLPVARRHARQHASSSATSAVS
jgi:hypothetical protein